MQCLQRLSALPQVEGIAFSRTKIGCNLHYTVIERHGTSVGENTGQTFKKIIDAINDFVGTLGELMPGSFLNLAEKPFARATGYFRSKRYASELDLIGIVHFVGTSTPEVEI